MFIIDVNLRQAGTADLIRETKAQYPEAKIVVLSDDFDLNVMMATLQAGAEGYCLATIGCDVLVKYIDLVMLGELVFPSSIFLSALSSRDKVPTPRRTPADGIEDLQAASAELPVRTLSSREAEILHCLMEGAPNKIIARRLEVAEATVKVHVKAILRKIRVANRTQAAMWAVAHLPATSMEAEGGWLER
ncbi:LuxR C-terminal-related transcriptional regulator [Microvirga alba]|uniref:Response regulator transcription factor n=1 Tax=Microvirga alba TaxID=2791025 RepID=A0A931FRD2_9HYPH|nr:response regulator transcription factor [Microvirga alba]MBF9234413.1 response regulator transcription factor [Microvirga alba]